MKNYKEMADSVFQRSHELFLKKEKRRKAIRKILYKVSCFCLVILFCFGIWKSVTPGKTPPLLNDRSDRESSASVKHKSSGEMPSDDGLASAGLPSDQADSSASQGNAPSEPSGSSETQGDASSDPDTDSAPPALSDDPPAHAVYRTIKTTYAEAKRLFGHPIIAYSGNGFLGLELAAVTPTGSIRDDNILYLSVIYLFRNGKIELIDQSRLGAGAYLPYKHYPSEEYKGARFWYDGASNNIYFPISDTLLMTANFDRTEFSEIYDLLLTLAVK